MCAIRGRLPGQGDLRLRFAQPPSELNINPHHGKFGQCSGYTGGRCDMPWIGFAAWSNCPLGSARVRLLRLLRARPAALGGSTLPGEATAPLGDLPPPRVLERVASQGHRSHHLLTTQATVPTPTRRSTAWATPTRSTASTRPSWPAMRTASRPRRCVTMPPLRRGPSRAMAPCRDAGVGACSCVPMHATVHLCD